MGTLSREPTPLAVPPASKLAFIVTVAPSLLDKLTPRACRLFITLLRRADGHSGELKVPGRTWNKAEPAWLKATQFDQEAHMSKPTRLKAMQELMALSLVTVARPRVHRMIGGRMRAVAGPIQYTVHRTPVNLGNHEKTAESSKVKGVRVLQGSNSSTVEKVDPQFLSNTPSTSPPIGARGGVEFSLHGSPKRASSSSPRKTDDDRSLNRGPVEEKAKPEQPKLDSALRAWMDARILRRAPEAERIRSRTAYLRASRPEFLENLAEEVEIYLEERAEWYMRETIDSNPTHSVCFGQVSDFVEAEVCKHRLPISTDPDRLFVRVWEFASEVLGLEDSTAEGDEPVPEVEIAPAPAMSAVASVEANHEVIAGSVGRDAAEPSIGNVSTLDEAGRQRRREMDQRFAQIQAARQMELDIAAADPKLLRAMRNGEISLTAAHARIAART